MKYSQPPIQQPARTGFGSYTREAKDTSQTSPRSDEGPDALAYTSSPSGARAQAVSFPTQRILSTSNPAGPRPLYTEQQRFVMALVIGLLYLVLLALMLYMSTGLATVGVTARRAADGSWVVTQVVPYGLAYDAQVRPGDIVVRANGLPVTGDAGLPEEADFIGTRTLDISKAGNSLDIISVDASSRSGGNPLHRWAFTLLSFIFIGVGTPVYVKARQRSAGSAFYIFCIATAVALTIAPAAFLANGDVLALMFASMVVWAASFVLFFFKFPVRVGKTRLRHALVISALLSAGSAVLIAYGWVLAGHPGDYAWVQPLQYLYIAACVAAGLASLGRSFFTERSPEIRQQLALLGGGTALAIGPSLLLYLIPQMLFHKPLMPIEITALALGLMPMAFAYAITQHQLLGIRSFLRRSVIYVVMGVSVLLVFSSIAAVLRAIAPQDWQSQELGLLGFGGFVLLIAVSYGYVQRHVERLVDKHIYHDAYDYKEALLSFSAQIAAEQNLHVLSEQLVERTCRLMNLTCGVLLLTSREDGYGSPLRHPTDPTGEPDESTVEQLGNFEQAFALAHNPVDWRNPLINTVRASEQNEPDLVPYARYGECSDWLINSLHTELSQLGINLQQANHSTQVIYINSVEPQVAQAAHQSKEYLAQSGTQNNAPLLTQPNISIGLDFNQNLSEIHSHLDTSQAKPSDYSTGNLMHHPGIDAARSFLGIPLWTRSRFAGILCLGDKKSGERFTKDDLSLLSTLGSQAALAIYNAQLYEMREQALLDTITALAHAIEAKDNYTINHCENITGRAVALAQRLALPRQEIENIRLGSILHDVGKIGIPDAILNKPSKLNDEEYEIIKQHAAIGARIVQSVGALQGVVPIVRHHQERYDGTGYPEGLAGDSIPIGARIIGVVDAYGAMTEDRVYRKAPGHDIALSELRRCAGKQFDPQVVKAFIRLLEDQPDLTSH